MERQTAQLVPTLNTLDEILSSVSGSPPASALFDGCKVKLFTGATVPATDSVLADFTETTAAGYAEITVATWDGPANPGSTTRGLLKAVTWVFGDNQPDGAEINGYYITNAAETTLLAAERFANAVNVLLPGDYLQLDLFIAIPQLLAPAA